MRRYLPLLPAVVLLTASTALAQGMPTPQQIDEYVKQAIDQLPDTSAEVEETAKELGVAITHKDVPTDAAAIAQQFPQAQQYAGMAQQFIPQAMPYLEKHLQLIGQLSTEHDLKIGSKTVPAGDYDFGLVMARGEYTPKGFVIQGEPLKKPVVIGFKKAGQVKDNFPNMRITLSAKGSSLYLTIGWARMGARTAAIKVKQ